jgi:hypothetical protein
MATRAMGPGAGWGWLKQAINLGSQRPTPIFAGAALVLGAVVVVGIGLVALMALAGTAFEPGGSSAMLMSFLVTLPILLVMSGLLVGYLRIVDAVENGGDPSAGDVFDGFRDRRACLRALGFMLALAIGQNLLMAGLIAVLAPDVGAWYLQAMQDPTAEPPEMTALPEGFGAAFAVMWVVSLFVYAVQAIGLGQIALGRSTVATAVVDGLAGAVKNLLPLIVLMLLGIVAALIAGAGIMLLMFVVGLLAKAVGAWIWIILGVPLYLALLIALIVVSFGTMYYMWRDICSGGPASPTTTTGNQLEL